MPANRGRTITSFGQMFSTISGATEAVVPPVIPPVIPDTPEQNSGGRPVSPEFRRVLLRSLFDDVKEEEIEDVLKIIKAIDALDQMQELKTVSTYTIRLMTIIRGFFNSGDIDTFTDNMISIVEQQLSDGWFSGMLKCGFEKEEINETENAALQSLISISLASINGFAEDLLAGKEEGKTANDFNYRVDLWANRYDEAFNQAVIMTCGDKKQKWIIDPTIKNCSTCLKLSNKVKRASTWDDAGVAPQATNGTLECNGFRCGCSLVDTDEPLSRGPLPNVP